MKMILNGSRYIQKSDGFQMVLPTMLLILYDSVLYFMFKLLDEEASTDLESRSDVTYLSDFFHKINEVNIKKLQGTKMCFIKAKGIIMAFISKLSFYINCLLRLDLKNVY